MKKAIRVIALVALVFLFSVAAYYIYDLFRVRSLNEKLAEIIHLEDQRTLTRQLTEFLENESWKLRQRAALAVGRIGGPGAGAALMPLLSDSSLDVARSAAFAMGLTGEKELASGLLEYAFELPSSVGATAVEAAGRLADSSMTDVILNLQEFFGHPSPDVRDAACQAAFLAGARSLSRDLIELAINEPDEIVQVTALYSLARMKIVDAGKAYVKFLAHHEPSVRTWAIRGLSNSSHPQAEHYLSIALNDGSDWVVAQAVSELGKKNTLQARQQIARKFGVEQDEKLVVVLLDALRQQGNDASIDHALRLLETDEPSDNIVAAVIRYLAAVQKDRAVNLIDSLQMTAEVTVRAACADAYRIIGHSNGIPRVAVLFNDEDPVVRASAFSALLNIDSANTEFYVGKAMNDRDMVLNVLAIDEIGQRRLAKYRSTLAELMADRETDLDIRRALVDAAGQFLDADSADTLMLQLVINGLLDRSYVVRREAAEVYKRITGKDRSDRVPPADTRVSVGQIKSLLDSFDELHPPYAMIVTNRGTIEMELFVTEAPLTVLNFMKLAKQGFYEGLPFHRVVPNFVVQGGDPRGDGWGGPNYHIRCEYSQRPYIRGAVGIATSGKDTGGSQFFITVTDQPHLEARYTVFGQVIGGMEVVDQIVQGDIIESIVIEEGL